MTSYLHVYMHVSINY